jgi:hypothetical protein
MENVAAALGVDPATLDPECWEQRTQTRYCPEPIGAALRRLRLAAGLSQLDVARAVGRTEAGISHWEPRRSLPPARFYPAAHPLRSRCAPVTG